jgi:hypothetical protein
MTRADPLAAVHRDVQTSAQAVRDDDLVPKGAFGRSL